MTQTSPINIALQGLGAAGKARQRALQDLPGFHLAGIISRRPEMGTLRLEEASQDPKIHALAISLENTAHASAVRQALEAGKHVLCDYPLALHSKEARELYRLAKTLNRILHVEHIGLLTGEHLTLKKEVEAKGPLLKGEYLFQGGWNEKIADLNRTGPYPIVAFSRLLQVADLFGPFVIKNYEIKTPENGFYLHLHLRFAGGGILGFREERMTGLPRRRSLSAQCQQGSLQWKAGLGSGQLFAQDLEWFRDRVQKGKSCYYDEDRMLSTLEELEKLF